MGGFLPALFEFGKAILIGAGAGASSAYVFAVNVARIGLLALGSKALTKKPRFTEAATSKQVTFRDPIAPQQIVYGSDMISGPIMFANVAGNDNEDLYIVIALAGHEIDSVTAYRIDSTDIPLTDITGSEDGAVNGGKFDGVATVDLLKGTTSQAVSTLLSGAFPSQFTASHTGRGWAYMVWKFSIVDGSEDVFKTQPQNIRAVVKGRIIYDPRLDTSPGANPDNATYFAWSDNPALCLADFLRDDKFGMREEADRIDWDKVVTAANVCDELVAVPPAASPENTQKRYTCNATFLSTETRKSVVEELISAMMGRLVFSQGVWKMWAGEAQTADVTLDEANLRGGIQLQASSPSSERYNRVRGKFIDPSRDYTAATYAEQRSSTYVTEDGGEVRELVVDFTSTQNEYEAQRKAITLLKQSRQQRIVSFEGNYSCFRLQPGTVVSLTIAELGFSGEKFFVSDWVLGDEGIDLTLVEEIDSAWSDPLVADYTVRSGSGTLTFGETGVAAPMSLTATNIPGGVRLSWTNPIESAYQYIEIHRANENVRGSAVLIGTTTGNTFYDTNPDIQGNRYYWIRAVDNLGRVSSWLPDLTTTTAVSYPETQLVTIVADPFIRQGASFWDLSDGRANYRSGEGTNGTDAIGLDTASGVNPEFYTAKRRGADIWDYESPGRFTITINYRVALRDAGGGTWTQSPRPLVRITDEASPENVQRYYAYQSQLKKLFTQADTLGQWFDESVTIEVDDSSGSPPRFIQVGFRNDSNLGGMEFMFDRIDAVIGNQVFVGSEGIGLVPDASGATASTDFLRADGTWAVPAGGGGASQLSDLSDVNTSTPTNRNVLVADGVDWESRALVEADISDLGSYVDATGTPVNNQIAIFTDANTVEGDADFTWDGAGLNIGSAGANFSRFFRSGATELQLQSTPQLRMTQSSAVIDAGAGGTFRSTNALITTQLDITADNSGGVYSVDSGSAHQFQTDGVAGSFDITVGATSTVLATLSGESIEFRHGAEVMAGLSANGAVSLYYDNVASLITSDYNGASGFFSGARVLDEAGTLTPVGHLTMNHINIATTTLSPFVSSTVGNNYWHKRIRYTGTGTATWRCDNSGNVPDGAVVWILAYGGDVTLTQGTGITIYRYLGTGAPSTGSATIARGGWATLVKFSDTTYEVVGLGVS